MTLLPRKFAPRSPLIPLIVLALVVASAAQTPASSQPAQNYPPTIVFMTDFGVLDDSVAICHGVMYSVMPSVRVVDLTHDVTPFSILDGARFLEGATPYFPAGTVFVVVIDPGVGSARKAIVARSGRGQYFVLPDNGLLTLVEQRDRIEAVREITNPEWMIGTKLSSTFHGRDIFSPAAAHLAAGWDYHLAGPEVAQLVQLTPKSSMTADKGIEGDIIGLDDPFGSLVTDIPIEEFKKLGYNLGEKVIVQINKKTVSLPYVKTFMDVPVGESLLYIDSRGRVGIAINQGNYSKKFDITPPGTIFIPRKTTSSKSK